MEKNFRKAKLPSFWILTIYIQTMGKGNGAQSREILAMYGKWHIPYIVLILNVMSNVLPMCVNEWGKCKLSLGNFIFN